MTATSTDWTAPQQAEDMANFSSPYAAVRPNARSTGARGQRTSRPASSAHPTRGRPVCCRHALVRARPVHQPARAAKASLQRSPARELEPYSYLLEPGGTSSAL